MSESTRTNALRTVLVEQVDAAGAGPRARWRLGALLAAVAVASATTGALTAGAIAQSDPYPPDITASLALSVARANSVLVGEPFHLLAAGETTVDLGEAPIDATGLALRLACTEAGSIDVSVDGVWASGMTCDSESPTGGSGTVYTVSGSRPHTLTVASLSGTGYEAWGAWVQEPPLPGPSAQQRAEMSDGVATREEYLAAFYRFSGCLGAEGFDISTDPDDLILNYALPSAAVDSGADEFCYRTQFMDVDTAWQLQNEDQSSTTLRMKECLSDRGLIPAERTADVIRQLEDAGIAVEECFA